MFNLIYEFNKLKDDFFYNEFNYQLQKGKCFPPFMVAWDCSRKCNLHCLHCGATKESYTQELTTEQVKSLIDQFSQIKVRFFGATGGEPLLRRDLLEVLSYAVKKGIKTGFATNGFLLDQKMAGKIKEAGISSIQISLDGVENTHNKIRGNQLSFKRAIGAIKSLQNQKIKIVSVATSITPLNFGELDELKKLLIFHKVRLWRLGVIMPIGRAESNELLLNSSQLRSLFEWVKKNNSRKLKIKIGENLPFLAEYEKKIRKSPLVCPVGFTACCIGVNGTVRGCPEMPDQSEFIEGNILDTSFIDIWKNGFKRYRNREILKTDQRCSNCKDKNYCFGGCWVMREGDSHCIYDLLKR